MIPSIPLNTQLDSDHQNLVCWSQRYSWHAIQHAGGQMMQETEPISWGERGAHSSLTENLRVNPNWILLHEKHCSNAQDDVPLLLFTKKVLLGYLGYSGTLPVSVYARHRRNSYINLLQSVGDTKDWRITPGQDTRILKGGFPNLDLWCVCKSIPLGLAFPIDHGIVEGIVLGGTRTWWPGSCGQHRCIDFRNSWCASICIHM